ncbi:MAG: SigE family RNA polymerase sigma factor [Terracoccus sp.]
MSCDSRDSRDTQFVAFLDAHRVTLFRTAYLLTGDPGRAEELMQDTMVRLYPQWERVTQAEAPLAYVRRSLVNSFTSSRRRRANRAVSLIAAGDPPAGGDAFAAVSDRSHLWQLLLTLPERQRAALVLRFFLDLPDAEIARSLACREATVRSLASRGLAALRRLPTAVLTATETDRKGPHENRR